MRNPTDQEHAHRVHETAQATKSKPTVKEHALKSQSQENARPKIDAGHEMGVAQQATQGKTH
jgi:hypothetical protein